MKKIIASTGGITLVEVLVSIAIIAILAALVIAISPIIRDKAEGAKCANNLRQLHVCFSSYVQDKGQWPQMPIEIEESTSEKQIEDWLVETMIPYGAIETLWRCPTIWRRITSRSKDHRPKTHYTPTMFDEFPGTPYKWPTQPWLVEKGDMHGHGPLLCYPDGSIHSLNEILANRPR